MHFMKSTHRPFSPALMGLVGVVTGLCFVVLGYAFIRDMSPREVVQSGRWMPAQEEQGVANKPSEQPNLAEVTTVGDMVVVPTTTREFAEDAFKQGPFRVIKVVESPDELYSYVIVTPRAEQAVLNSATTSAEKMINDQACGSRYTQPVCYLFREGKYHVNSDPEPKLIATWSGGAFSDDTAVRFVKRGSNYLMQFTAMDGDAGCSARFSHQVDLATNQYSLLNRTDSCIN